MRHLYSGGVTTTYYLNGSQIAAEETNGNITVYIYDYEGLPLGMQYHGASYAEDEWDVYWYEKNIFGDIVAVYNEAGTKLISYNYDAWGNFTESYHNGTTSSSIAARNPFRYRGYYYDKDLGLYYLQTRYYDSVTGRFINADGYVSTGQGILGNNMFAYCNNNPVMFTDPDGEWPKLVDNIFNGIGRLTNDITGYISSFRKDENITERLYLYCKGETIENKDENKIYVEFSTEGDNPEFIIYDSYKIRNKKNQKAILEYIMKSEYYSQEVYGRTLDSMLTEWKAHNHVCSVYYHERVAHVNFDKNSEALGYWDYWNIAYKEVKENGLWGIFK